MNKHTPDRWMIVKIEGSNIPLTYKVFACWYGGFLGADSWRLNSGIKSAKRIGAFWEFEGYSGSIYSCHKKTYGTNMFGAATLDNLIAKAAEKNVKLETMPPESNWGELDYNVK
jgi:hypothetical protein